MLSEELKVGKVLLQFGASYCQPCRTMKPIAAEAAQAAGVRLEYIDVETQLNIATKFNVRAVPTFIALNDGDEVGRIRGIASATALQALLS